MNRIRLLAGALASFGLTGCIVLPPSPMPYRPPPPMLFGDARRPPPPGWGMCPAEGAPVPQSCARGVPGEPGPQPPGAR
ncbi:hypothetical protein FHT32_000623 [Variovorax sp. SG517]|nr:hypothetical protein [Variovorax sp. SG517]